ncbi:Smr/MutS family protein [Sphingobacterium sp. Mn56C]|uniref:Smr/MutS family protein n=1 Tax=Sphingobacterium sp. Mn56C TaxID=3395261 RepID=UPI003BC8FE0D
MPRELPKPPKTVDLHADSFLMDWEDYDAAELLMESIDRLRETLDAAIYWDYNEIRYIHGKGKGTLREAVYAELRAYKNSNAIANFHPAYHNDDIVVVHIGL